MSAENRISSDIISTELAIGIPIGLIWLFSIDELAGVITQNQEIKDWFIGTAFPIGIEIWLSFMAAWSLRKSSHALVSSLRAKSSPEEIISNR